ncbi:uncharacterized protein LOC122026571 [Zingiber officinale]|uniref:uncharacterized protein LOC122026571 n=1 Tax=Zingiber officinale TaxID=94328 RepID=UPI001C4CAD7E|nr:uncharacterized protein LOC122026571 [Zingiber officinale]
MQVYKEAYEKMKGEFKEVTVTKIPRAENGRADELAKMASSLSTWTLDRSIAQTFLVAQIDLQNNAGEVIDWRAPIMSFLQQGAIPTSPEEARMIRRQAHSYAMIGDQLYKKSFSRPLLKCLNMEEADQALREIHSGCCEVPEPDAQTYRAAENFYSILPFRPMRYGYRGAFPDGYWAETLLVGSSRLLL